MKILNGCVTTLYFHMHSATYIGDHSFLMFAQCARKFHIHMYNYSDILYRYLIMNMGGEK